MALSKIDPVRGDDTGTSHRTASALPSSADDWETGLPPGQRASGRQKLAGSTAARPPSAGGKTAALIATQAARELGPTQFTPPVSERYSASLRVRASAVCAPRVADRNIRVRGISARGPRLSSEVDWRKPAPTPSQLEPSALASGARHQAMLLNAGDRPQGALRRPERLADATSLQCRNALGV